MQKFFLSLIFIMGLLLTGCVNNTEVKEMPQSNQGKYSVLDARGKQITFSAKPQRIVSSYVYADEILLDLVAHNRIVGLSKWVHDPGLSMAVEQAKDVTGIVENNAESVLMLKPDLVLISSNSKSEIISSLEDLGITVYVYNNPTGIKDIPVTIEQIGKAVGEEQQASALKTAMQLRLENIERQIALIPESRKKKGLLFLRFGAIGGQGSIFNDLLSAAGIIDCYNIARPVGSEKPGQSRILSKEEVVKANPDFLILGSWNQGGAYQDADKYLEEIYDDPALATVTAVRERQAIIIPQGYVNCLSHHAAESVEKLYQAVYAR